MICLCSYILVLCYCINYEFGCVESVSMSIKLYFAAKYL